MLFCSFPLLGPALKAPPFGRVSGFPVAALALGSVSGLALAMGGALQNPVDYTAPVTQAAEAVVPSVLAMDAVGEGPDSLVPEGIVLAQAAAPNLSGPSTSSPDAPARPLGAGVPVPAAAEPSPAQASAAAGKELGSGFRFEFAPLRWRGNISDSVAWARSGKEPARLRHFQSGNIGVASYLWQPWFLQFSANVGLTTGTERGGDTSVPGARGGRDTTVVGGADFLLFPASRFPFTASFSRTDSRTGATQLADDFTNTRISLRQDYAPLRSPLLFSVGYDRSEVDGQVQGKDVVDVFRGSMSWRGAQQQLNVNLSHTQNTTEGFTGTRFDSAIANHTWQLRERLNLTNSLTLSSSTTGIAAGSGGVRSSTFGLSSIANWLPDTERPLSISGGVQYYHFDFGGSNSQTANALLSANYSLSPNLSIYGSSQIAHITTAENTDVIGLITAGAYYNSDLITFGGFGYTWNASTAGTTQWSDASGNASTLTASIGHGINRSFQTGERSTLTLAANQGVSGIVAKPTGNSVGLSHGLNGSWTFRQSDAFTMRFTLGASDSRFVGDSDNSYQSLSAQLDGNLYLDRYSSASAALTVQSIRQDLGAELQTADRGFRTNVYGTLGYQHNRVFGVPLLRYSLLYTGNTQQLNGRAQGNPDAPPKNVAHALEQRLDYRIGRLDLQALARFSKIEGENNSFVFFSINRAFGAY